MADYVGGDILEVTANHPTLGESKFYCKAGEDGTFDRGGFTKNDDAQSITGDGQPIYQMNRKRWSVELPPITWDQIDRDEMDILQKIQNSPVSADWTISITNGSVFAGKGTIVGDLNATQMDPQITVKIAGGGTLDKIS